MYTSGLHADIASHSVHQLGAQVWDPCQSRSTHRGRKMVSGMVSLCLQFRRFLCLACVLLEKIGLRMRKTGREEEERSVCSAGRDHARDYPLARVRPFLQVCLVLLSRPSSLPFVSVPFPPDYNHSGKLGQINFLDGVWATHRGGACSTASASSSRSSIPCLRD